uniref:Acetyl-coenzyme A synthetase n=1 Tax=Parascaris univalens TaxID=6257 RepID=A0A914ZVS0_PARUN
YSSASTLELNQTNRSHLHLQDFIVMGMPVPWLLPLSPWQALGRNCYQLLRRRLPFIEACSGFQPLIRSHIHTQDADVSNLQSYRQLYDISIHETDTFWKTVAGHLFFKKTSDKGLEWNFDHRKGDVFVRFMDGARTNVAYNCLERNIARGYGSRIAYLWEGNEPGDSSFITYEELLDRVVRFSAVLRSRGVRKGDVVAIYLPMIIELPIAMLACARIGALHSVVFAGFSAVSLSSRLLQAKARVLVTCDGYFRGAKFVPLKSVADNAIAACAKQGEPVDSVIVVRHLDRIRHPGGVPTPEFKYHKDKEVFYDEEMERIKGVESPVEWTEAEDPLFILYTSGSTGKPKGVVHTTAGYMTYAYATTQFVFDTHPDRDIYWCTADCGWITGHSYLVYGPLLNGLTSVIFEGVPTYPSPSRMWQIVDKYKVTTLYTAPTAIRSLMSFGDDHILGTDRASLRILGSVGEPINPEAWRWFHNAAKGKDSEVVDTYWQTETGGHVIAPLPGATPTKPGSATLPFFGIVPALVDADGHEIEGTGEGSLCIKRAWPGICRTVFGDHARYISTYFSPFPGYFFTGDGARRDDDGYIWITGRIDDLMNVSGHLLSTVEIESALLSDTDVVEAAVVAAPHEIKGSLPYAFVSLKRGVHLTEEKVNELKDFVRHHIGAIAVPDVIQEVPALPKTRSGKITRRILRKIAEGDEKADLGDTTTLVDESIIGRLWTGRRAMLAR